MNIKLNIKKSFTILALCTVMLMGLSTSGTLTNGSSWLSPLRAAQAAEPIFKTLTPQEAQLLILKTKNLMIIDVRGQGELTEGWIDRSVLMPMPEILNGTKVPPKNRPILFVCAVGGRSVAIGGLLSRYGWNEVYNLKGGISAWKEAGLPLKYK